MNNLDVGCTTKFLPQELNVIAAETAIRQNPINRVSSDSLGSIGITLSKDHLAVMSSKYWGANGVSLTVGFLESTPMDLKKRILSHMNAWNEYANVEFILSDIDPQVRITRDGQGYWSYLGTDILHIPKGEPTMCLQQFTMQTPEMEYKRVVRHEVGHTLGFPHEHMRRAIVERIDPNKAIKYYQQTQGWPPSVVYQQVLTPLAESSIFGTNDADETSIMTYQITGLITKDGRPILGGFDIAPQDAEFVAKIYPKKSVPPKPPEIASGTGMDFTLDFERKIAEIRLPKGWTINKKANTEGVVMTDVDLVQLSTELESCLPASGPDLDAAKQHAIMGGVVGKILELVNALKAQDIRRIALAVIDLLNVLIGDTKTEPTVTNGDGDVTISFATQASALKLDWAKLISVLVKLLPLILGG
jgi:hypothetical protein